MKQLNILNVYQINILQHLLFMFKAKNNIIPRAFMQTFYPTFYHIYPTRFSDNSFKTCNFNLNLTRNAIGFRGPTIRNKFLTENEKSCTSIAVFKTKIKEKILNFSNELLYF